MGKQTKTKKAPVQKYTFATTDGELEYPETVKDIATRIQEHIEYAGVEAKKIKVFKLVPVKFSFTPAKFQVEG